MPTNRNLSIWGKLINSTVLSLFFALILTSCARPAYSPGYSSTYSTGKPKTVHVRGYTRKNGTYVNSYYRSAPTRRK